MELCFGLGGLETKLQNDGDDESVIPQWSGEEKEMWQKWFDAMDPKVRRYLLSDNQMMIHGYIRQLTTGGKITPLRVIELILFYYPMLPDLIVTDSVVHTLTKNDPNEYELIMIGKNATLTTKWRQDWYAKIKCVQLIMEDGARIHVNKLGLWDKKEKPLHKEYDGVTNLKEIELKRGHGFICPNNEYRSNWLWYGHDTVGGGIIDIECKDIVIMGHNASITANGIQERAYGGSIRLITSTLKMESTAKIEAKPDGKIIVGVEENKENVIQMSNISPKPIFGKKIHRNKDKWKITASANDESAENGKKEVDDDAYWDNYFKNNSLI